MLDAGHRERRSPETRHEVTGEHLVDGTHSAGDSAVFVEVARAGNLRAVQCPQDRLEHGVRTGGHLDAAVRRPHEGHPLAFPLHNHPQCRALNASGGETGAHLRPQFRRHPEAVQVIEDAAGAGGLHQVRVN
ncbi:MAG: hypothetical protein RJA51_1164 [Actinomycetota bacterium]